MTAPAKGSPGEYLTGRTWIGEGIASDPWLALSRHHITVFRKARPALMPQRGFDVLPGAQPIEVLCGRHHIELAPHFRYLQILDRVQQFANTFDIVRIDGIALLNRPLRVSSEREQLIGIDALCGALSRQRRPQW